MLLSILFNRKNLSFCKKKSSNKNVFYALLFKDSSLCALKPILFQVKNIKTKIESVVNSHGRNIASNCFIKFFVSNQFQYDDSASNSHAHHQRTYRCTLYDFISRASTRAKTGYNNTKKKNKTKGLPAMEETKTEVDFNNTIDINLLEFSLTHEVRNLKAIKDQLDTIKLNDRFQIVDKQHAQKILSGKSYYF